jgi:5-formyltetrahydrofolate cyclo-ligase
VVVTSEIRQEKRRLRTRLRTARRSLSAVRGEEIGRALARVAERIPALPSSTSIVCYLADDGEPDTAPLIQALRMAGKQIFLPRCLEKRSLELVALQPGAALRPSGPGGVLEPEGEATQPDSIPGPVVLLVPSVALDATGARLGRGGGFYDGLLPRARTLRWCVVGVCHAAHVVDRVPTEAHDQPVDALLTEDGYRPAATQRPLATKAE